MPIIGWGTGRPGRRSGMSGWSRTGGSRWRSEPTTPQSTPRILLPGNRSETITGPSNLTHTSAADPGPVSTSPPKQAQRPRAQQPRTRQEKSDRQHINDSRVDQDFGTRHASGGLRGDGLGKGSPQIVPFANSDFIVASVGEELGLAGILAC
jgi:hypothetical protein